MFDRKVSLALLPLIGGNVLHQFNFIPDTGLWFLYGIALTLTTLGLYETYQNLEDD